jgi:hypothetical protein
MIRFIFLLSFLSVLLLSQKYEGDLQTSEPRIRDFKEQGSFPEQMRFYFKAKEGDYIIFYDLDGNEALFQYRRNRFDYESERKLVGLFSGQTYIVKGSWKAMLVYFDPSTKKHFFPPELNSKDELTPEILRDPQNKPVFQLDSFESTALEQVIY